MPSDLASVRRASSMIGVLLKTSITLATNFLYPSIARPLEGDLDDRGVSK